ncbi:Scarecrow-like protein 6 [Quillaja saponaria]|uniref:Scarecrow-like protein 6 n=1 Tax=Quillaja saponaria TaxID=32244 RepID=A0AAD7LRG0_QUISA|nr:Scarecrow-like protein 6 [Quillaja saponaria]
MKAMPLPFEEFRGKGVLDFTFISDSFSLLPQEQPQKWNINKEHCYVGSEPTSVLDVRRNPSPPTSSSTLSSSHGSSGGVGGSGSTDSTTGVAATVSKNPLQSALDIATEKCGMGMEDWESVLSESPGQDQSILRLIMGDIEDPSMGLSKLLQSGSGSHDGEFNGGFGVMDQGFVLEPITSGNLVSSIDPSVSGNCSDFPFNTQNVNSNIARFGTAGNPNGQNPIYSTSASNLSPVPLSSGMFHSQQQQAIETVDEKPQILNTQLMINQNQSQYSQNPAFMMPLTYSQLQEHHLLSQPPQKRPNSGSIGPNYQVPKVPFLDSGQELFLRRQQQQLQLLPQHLQQRPPMMVSPKQKMVSPGGEDLATHQLQQAITDQLFKAAELIETGNPILAQGILARLNHQLPSNGKPFQRAAFYMKEALQLLLHSNTNNSLTFSPISLIFKIGAYKSFSEISPVLQFANFTCNQALLEAVEGYDRIHIVDFDIGFGGQWASFIQELALRNGGAPSLKITAFVSPSTHDEIELSFTHENLKQYASEIHMSFELEILSLEALNSASLASTSLGKSCDRTDVPFAHHLIHALQSYSALFESLDAVNVTQDVLQMIEKHFLQPAMEKIVLGRHRSPERTPPWRTLLLSSGFTPLTFSNFTESQAECLVQRTLVRGFHVEKRQSSLVLCWQRKELVSVSTWRC